MKKIIFFAGVFFSSIIYAFDNPYIMRSPRGILMGDAFTAVNDDEYTLFYNPATLARHKSDLTLSPFSGQINATNVLSDLDKFKNFPSEPVGAADLIMDYPVHASAGVAPGFKLFNFGVSFIANESFDLLLRNRAHPMLDIDRRSDRGMILGFGIPLGTSRINRKSQTGSQTSLGISTKYIERTGVRDTLALAGPTVLGALGQGEVKDIVKTLGEVRGIGWGYDAGVEHVYRNGPTQFVASLAALDIMGTEFTVNEDNPHNLKVADNRSQVNLGLAAGQDMGLIHYILSADIRALNEQMDFGKRFRLGAQVGIPLLTFFAGMNSGYYSYGALVDLKILQISLGLYDVELGSRYQQVQSKRFVIYLSLFDFSFDA